MSSKSFDDAYYAQALSGIKEQLSNWILKHESVIQPNLAHLPVEAFAGLNLAFSEVKSSQFAELYKKSSFFRTSLLQQFIANKICKEFLSGVVGPANLQAKINELPKFFTADYDTAGLRKKVLLPCIELASKMLQENRLIIPMMIPAGTLFDVKFCSSIQSKSSSEPILFCQFPLITAKQGPNSYVISKAPVNMVSEWSFTAAPKFVGAISGASMLAGLDAIEHRPKSMPPITEIAQYSGASKERSTVSETSEVNKQLASDAFIADRRASKFKKMTLGLAILSFLLLVGLIAAAAIAGTRKFTGSGFFYKGDSRASNDKDLLFGQYSDNVFTGSSVALRSSGYAVVSIISPVLATVSTTSPASTAEGVPSIAPGSSSTEPQPGAGRLSDDIGQNSALQTSTTQTPAAATPKPTATP